MDIKQPRIVSLFSGAGGLDIGFHKAGFKTVFATDIWDKACETLKNNGMSERIFCGDVIKDFLVHGYYIENENQYKDGTRGKVNWRRTVQKKKPVYNNGNLVYLDLIVKTNKINSNNMITRIHEWSVFGFAIKVDPVS